MEVLKGIPCDQYILACPKDSVSALAPLAEKTGFELVFGPKEDVLNRYCIAIRRFQIDRVIRATADNPFVFVDAARQIHREAAELEADYAAYNGLPYGAGVESVAAEALFRAEREAALAPEREHVCPYLYTHSGLFLLHRPLAPRIWRSFSIRLTVDTREDYERARILYDALSAIPNPEERGRGKTIIETFEKNLDPPEISVMEYIN
jgi:spore coat polysaccharide biosynthesis protein SpsF